MRATGILDETRGPVCRGAARRIDLTDSQFSDPGARFASPDYVDELSSVAAALETIPKHEYDALASALAGELGR